MTDYDKYFPYDSYRPHQQNMLNAVYEVIKKHDILMINAPTGSGKSSVVVPAIAMVKNQRSKLIIAVRTISQLNIFINELDKVRKKCPELTFAYLVGKQNMCPMYTNGKDGTVYTMCDNYKRDSLKYMTSARLDDNNGDYSEYDDCSSLDNVCSYYVKCKQIHYTDSKPSLIPSKEMADVSNYLLHNTVPYDKLKSVIGENICPYETTIESAKNTDIIIVNYHHLFNDNIRNQLYHNLGVDESNTILILDEAHNLGKTVEDICSIDITSKMIEKIVPQIKYFDGQHTENILDLLSFMQSFMSEMSSKDNPEDVFSSLEFINKFGGDRLYRIALDELESIIESSKNNIVIKSEYKEGSAEAMYEFLTKLMMSIGDLSYISIYKKTSYGMVLEIKNIDPSEIITNILSVHLSSILISGTLSPVNMYKKYYFGDKDIKTMDIPNCFPKENRKIYIANDVTTMYAQRNNKDNINNITSYINTFVKLPGNIAVFFTSYNLLTYYYSLISKSNPTNKEIFVEPKRASEANIMLNKFINLPKENKSGIMFAVCGGKWSEGLDYCGDMLNAAMVIGLPLATFTPVQKVINYHYKNKFGQDGEFIAYTLPAINRACQSLGRVIRTENDKGTLVLLDSRYNSAQTKRGLPEWINSEAIKTNCKMFIAENSVQTTII